MAFPALQTTLHGRAAGAPASTGSQGTVERRVSVLYEELAFFIVSSTFFFPREKKKKNM